MFTHRKKWPIGVIFLLHLFTRYLQKAVCFMTEPQKQLVKQWVRKAENDLLNVTNNLQADQTPWDTVCFHCQQAVEKYFKAVLVVHEQEIPRTHDLEQLCNLIQSWIPGVEEQRDELRWLTTYAVISRYPVEIEDASPGKKEGKRAHQLAKAIRNVCRNYIKEVAEKLIEDEKVMDALEEDIEEMGK